MWRDKYVWYRGERCKVIVWGKDGYKIEYQNRTIWVSEKDLD